MHGGGNFWREYKDEYETVWDVRNEEDTSENILDIEIKSSHATNSVFNIGCIAPKTSAGMAQSHVYQVNLLQQGKVSRHLLRPRLHKGSVKISCEPPASQRLLWSQSPQFKVNNMELLPRSRIMDNARTHYALINTEHYVRLIMLDKRGFAFLNHSSILSEISTTDTHLATVHALPSDIPEAERYSKRYVLILN